MVSILTFFIFKNSTASYYNAYAVTCLLNRYQTYFLPKYHMCKNIIWLPGMQWKDNPYTVP